MSAASFRPFAPRNGESTSFGTPGCLYDCTQLRATRRGRVMCTTEDILPVDELMRDRATRKGARSGKYIAKAKMTPSQQQRSQLDISPGTRFYFNLSCGELTDWVANLDCHRFPDISLLVLCILWVLLSSCRLVLGELFSGGCFFGCFFTLLDRRGGRHAQIDWLKANQPLVR